MNKTPWPADSVEKRSIRELMPYARNARLHSPAQVDQIAASIKEWGWTIPVLVDEKGVLIAGHGRLMAAKKLGIEEVPVMVALGWSEEKKRAYVLADNKLSLNASWDSDLLSLELKELRGANYDIGLVGFSDDELHELFAQDKEGLVDEDFVPDAPADPITESGDVWLLGDHRLMCGDSTSADAIIILMGGQKADMVFTDPPYGMSYGGGRAKGNHARNKRGGALIKAHGEILGDDLRDADLVALVRDAIGSAKITTKEGASYYVCFPWRTYSEFEAALKECGIEINACIVWNKKSIGLGNSNYRPQHEFIFYSKGAGWYGDKSQSDVWDMSRGATGQYVHPTQKPVELIEKALLNSSRAGDIVIDCFGGSGSAMIAAEKNGRKACLMELDPKYCDVIIRRWEQYSGKKAIHEKTRQTFLEVGNERKKTETA
jgi:DNA modification methylase